MARLYDVSEPTVSRIVTEYRQDLETMARDLIRGDEPIAVSEGTATQTLKQWDRIAAHIVSVLGKNIFAGGLLPYASQATDALFDGLRHVFGKKGAKKLPAIADQDLQSVASMFTLSWLIDTLDRAMGLPPMQNSDGDDLMFHDARFPLVTGVTQKDIATRVNAILAMAQENATSTVSEQPTENLRASLNAGTMWNTMQVSAHFFIWSEGSPIETTRIKGALIDAANLLRTTHRFAAVTPPLLDVEYPLIHQLLHRR